ncbi:hypothetical protein [Methanoculleus chikugoensis]|uniref:hypothetical protein n=1 Tax=Methanoculleus chikugoensis TaxID=118126 RepID=UPI000A4B885A|nr:hypothetical protein [Methanoculleus chikugoensis]
MAGYHEFRCRGGNPARSSPTSTSPSRRPSRSPRAHAISDEVERRLKEAVPGGLVEVVVHIEPDGSL